MTRVYIAKNWDWPDLMRQTPGERGIWEDIEFTLQPVASCDYVIVLNGPARPLTVSCPPQHVWSIMQEPPTGYDRARHRGIACSSRVYTQDVNLRGPRYVQSQPALPWHVNRNYDYLVRCSVPEKERSLSWVTSNKDTWAGHGARLRFLERIRGRVRFDLYGRGFRPIEDKWDALAPYRYSIAVESFQNPYYWSEKIADCFLAWTMPIYSGCSRIEEYFPAEAMIRIEIRDVERAVQQINDAIAGDAWRRRLDAIAEARRLVLTRHQLFAFVTGEIRAHEAAREASISQAQPISISNRMRFSDAWVGLLSQLRWKGMRLLSKTFGSTTAWRRKGG